MNTNLYKKLQNKVAKINKEELFTKICRNIKKFRLEKYREFKKNINPFSTENIAALLDYNHTFYKRFESENDNTKFIPLDKLIKLSIILDKDINDFFK